jgi:esterase/lipase
MAPIIHNPHLEGNSFYWHGNHIGILLSHGFTATTPEVRLLAQILHKTGYTIFAPLLPETADNPSDVGLHLFFKYCTIYLDIDIQYT